MHNDKALVEAKHLNKKIGAKFREIRQIRGMTQTDLADRLGLSFQQVQKYETGTNRISAARLFQTARIVEVPVTYFFELEDEDVEMPSWALRLSSKLRELPVEEYEAINSLVNALLKGD